MDARDDTFAALIAEAKRQNLYKPSIAERLMELARFQPFRTVWRARAAWLLFAKWNAPKGHEARATLRQEWEYSGSLAEMLDDYGPMSPSEAIDTDRQYWED